MDFSPLNSSNPFPWRCKLRLFQEQQVKHDCDHSLVPGPAGREQHLPLGFIPFTLPVCSCPLGIVLHKGNSKAVPKHCLRQDYINMDQTYMLMDMNMDQRVELINLNDCWYSRIRRCTPGLLGSLLWRVFSPVCWQRWGLGRCSGPGVIHSQASLPDS